MILVSGKYESLGHRYNHDFCKVVWTVVQIFIGQFTADCRRKPQRLFSELSRTLSKVDSAFYITSIFGGKANVVLHLCCNCSTVSWHVSIKHRWVRILCLVLWVVVFIYIHFFSGLQVSVLWATLNCHPGLLPLLNVLHRSTRT